MRGFVHFLGLRSVGAAIISISFLVTSFSLHAEVGNSVTLDFPLSETQSLPDWVKPLPAAPGVGIATETRLAVDVDESRSDLALSLFFHDSSQGFLKVYWEGHHGGELLSPNLLEGVTANNRRTLLLRHETIQGGGTLVIQSTIRTSLRRVRLEWTQRAILSSDVDDFETASLILNGHLHRTLETGGGPYPLEEDAWRGQVIHAPLVEQPALVEAAVECIAPLEQTPRLASLFVKIASLPLDDNLDLWVNDVAVGQINLPTVELDDAGLIASDPDGKPDYYGWRRGSIYIPANLLVAGDNKIQIRSRLSSESGISVAFAIKDVELQGTYDISTPPSPSSPIQNAAVDEPVTENNTEITPELLQSVGPLLPNVRTLDQTNP